MNKLIRLKTIDLNFLSPVRVFLNDVEEVSLFLSEEVELERSRRAFDGIFTMILHTSFGDVALVYHDFKIYGGSYSSNNSKRFIEFLNVADNLPMIYVINTIGVRVMEGRKVFSEAFKVIPSLKKYSEKNLLVTASIGKCLGLGALLYSLGDYQMSVSEKSEVNLTGPEVMKMFFGQEFDFNSIARVEKQQQVNMLVHDIAENKEDMADKAFSIIRAANLGEFPVEDICKTLDKTQDIINTIAHSKLEVFQQFDCGVKTFIISRNKEIFGLFINPLDRAKMLDVKTIRKYRMALNLFKKMSLPIISVVDIPGADPRASENDKDLIRELTSLTGEIIDYPYLKFGIVSGRCYGGASVLSIPPFFGGGKILVLEGSHVGIMGDSIISHLLSSSPRFLAEWKQNKQNEGEHLEDFIESGIVDRVFSRDSLEKELDDYLENLRRHEDIPDDLEKLLANEVPYEGNAPMIQNSLLPFVKTIEL